MSSHQESQTQRAQLPCQTQLQRAQQQLLLLPGAPQQPLLQQSQRKSPQVQWTLAMQTSCPWPGQQEWAAQGLRCACWPLLLQSLPQRKLQTPPSQLKQLLLQRGLPALLLQQLMTEPRAERAATTLAWGRQGALQALLQRQAPPQQHLQMRAPPRGA